METIVKMEELHEREKQQLEKTMRNQFKKDIERVEGDIN